MRNPTTYRHYGQTSRRRMRRSGVEDYSDRGFDPQTLFALTFGYRHMAEWLEGFQADT